MTNLRLALLNPNYLRLTRVMTDLRLAMLYPNFLRLT